MYCKMQICRFLRYGNYSIIPKTNKVSTLSFFKKNRIIILITIAVLAGAFLRTYHFSDWIHFELDQSRDAKVIDTAYTEGIGNLPLLGPRAAGSFLRLGPFFYYFNYLSALIFGNTPAGIAAITAIFGILAIPIFYAFVSEYFEKRISVVLLFIFAFSLFFIIYSRFSWNPNPLPFFTIATFYCLLKATKQEEKRKGMWLILWAFFLALATQFHFLAFVALPVISLAYLIIKRPKIKIGYWALSLAVIFLIYSPAIINDIKTGGDNIGELKKVIQKKSDGGSHSLYEKIIKDYMENSIGHFLILTGQRAELPDVAESRVNLISCKSDCRNYLFQGLVAILIYSFGLALLIKNLVSEKNENKKNFLILSSLWFIVSFGLFIPLSFDISPRFFLLISALPLVFIGLILDFISHKISKKAAMVAILIIAFVLVISNFLATKERFSELGNASEKSFDIQPDRFLKERTRVTLGQQDAVVGYVESFYQENKFHVYLYSEPFYTRSLLFLLGQKNVPNDEFSGSLVNKKIYRNGNYFLVFPALSNLEARLSKYTEKYSIAEKKEFGTLVVFRLVPKEESINALEKEASKPTTPDSKQKKSSSVPVRYNWNEIF